MITAKIRKWAFILTDALKGSPVRSQYRDIKEIMESEAVFRLREKRYIQNLLTHATSTTEFYKEFIGCTALKDFPVIDKLQINANPNAFISDAFKSESLHAMKSGGSTGIPVTIYQDKRKRNRVLDELIYFMNFCGVDIGMQFIYFRRLHKAYLKKYLKYSIKENMILADPSNLDAAYLEEIRKRLKRKKILFIRGYASAIGYVGSYLKSCGDTPDQFNVKAIQCSAEVLSEHTRQNLISVFNCPVLSRYSNSENGVLAHECQEYKEFHVNCASYHIEILKMDTNEPASEGEVGRIVVTDLFNYAMPLIRYDTGDLGSMGKNMNCRYKTPIITKLAGRAIHQIYSTDGTPISPLIIPVPPECWPSILQYQIIQEEQSKYRLKLIDKNRTNSDIAIMNFLKDIFGQDADITIEYVEEIPLLPSGKHQQTVNNYKIQK